MRLGIDYGTVATRAVLAWPDGRWSMVTFDGADRLSSGVYVDADALAWAGQLARDRATADPAGFVPYPKRHLTRTHIQVRDRRIEVVDLVAATLHHVGEQAARAAGQPADEVTLTVPAGWGPARRTLLRRAATRAGLPQPHLVDTPTAVANHLLATGITVPVGTAVLMCDFGAGRFEATILTRGSEGFEVLSTVESLDAGGLALDTALADHPATLTATLVTAPTIATPAPPTAPPPPLPAPDPAAVAPTDPATATPPASPAYLPAPGTATADTAAPGAAVAGTAAADMVAADSPHAFDGRLAAIEAAHAAIQTLAHTPAVAVPTAAGLPIVTDQPTLHTVAGPVVAQIGQVARTAVTAADHPAAPTDPTRQTRHPALRRPRRPRRRLPGAAHPGHQHRLRRHQRRHLRPAPVRHRQLGRIRHRRAPGRPDQHRRCPARDSPPRPHPVQGRPGHPTRHPPHPVPAPPRRRRHRRGHRRPLRRHRRRLAPRPRTAIPARHHPLHRRPHRRPGHHHRTTRRPPPTPTRRA